MENVLMLRMVQLVCCSRTGLLYRLTGIIEKFVNCSVKEAVVCVCSGQNSIFFKLRASSIWSSYRINSTAM